MVSCSASCGGIDNFDLRGQNERVTPLDWKSKQYVKLPDLIQRRIDSPQIENVQPTNAATREGEEDGFAG